MSARAEISRESVHVPDHDGSAALRRGRFEVTFAAERGAKAAARDARAVGFLVDVTERDFGGWLIVSRRKNDFPADDGDRYASRLRTIAGVHGGEFDRFVPE